MITIIVSILRNYSHIVSCPVLSFLKELFIFLQKNPKEYKI